MNVRGAIVPEHVELPKRRQRSHAFGVNKAELQKEPARLASSVQYNGTGHLEGNGCPGIDVYPQISEKQGGRYRATSRKHHTATAELVAVTTIESGGVPE